ncbi:monosaccharide ABC transporter substrate-binding protein (CUT2 family) [Pseudonocardia hierapolitana]|uniref:Monosaccharide ABC transporter substrate-binding protein (CUT2 family) n=1 Tax=Pseudonocardia hierapolitana TaxID=1128676 RepID=A0A561SQK6_9PSEU|nr:autoinducer 2 ABC transporter substrate-binding protein [Pseudonocardia hierapolitana]TWF77154.1 monosaccharide ABC transporter substrate-binding protein (CUT2 family) [Pseudonocardia hierapolitana]
MLSRRITAALAVAAAGALALTGCTQQNPGGGGGGGGGGEDRVSVAFVPKLQGIPYFEAMNTGGQKAAQELGIEWIYRGSSTADPGAQTEIVNSLIQQRVDVLVVAPNDPDSMAPVLQEAADAGIKVMTSDTDAPNSVREAFVNQATPEGIGTALTDALLEAMGGSGKYAIVSCGQTAANLNSWIEVQKQVTAEKYPNAQIVDIVYAGEDEAQSVTMAKDLMNAHPDLKGLVGECTASAPGVAKAVTEAGKIGQVFTVGLGTPQSMKQYLENGSSSAAILWDVEQLGYLTAWAGLQVASGTPFQASNAVNDQLPAVAWDANEKMLLLGDPLRITNDNVNNYEY